MSFDKLKESLLAWGFSGSKSDTSVFIYSRNNIYILFLVYVDDILVTENSDEAISRLVSDLHRQFSLKQLENLHYFLGIEAFRDNTWLYLSQSKYVVDLLVKTKMTGAKTCSTPAAPSQTLTKGEGEPMSEPTLYRSTAGALQYLTLTRPDIAYSVNKLSQFLHSPTDKHWLTCKRVLQYLKGTATHGIRLQPSSTLSLVCFVDADWARCSDDMRSTSAYCVYLGAVPYLGARENSM